MQDIRCPKCKKLNLKAKGNAILECKCPRCSEIFVAEVKTEE